MQSHPESIHYFCRKCGTIWARLISSQPSYHFTVTGHCEACDDDAMWAAPLLCEGQRFRILRFPIAALRRDFLYLMDKLYPAPVISNNLPGSSHDQHKAA